MHIQTAPLLAYDEDGQSGFTIVGEGEITSRDTRIEMSFVALNKEHDEEVLSFCSFKIPND